MRMVRVVVTDVVAGDVVAVKVVGRLVLSFFLARFGGGL